MSTLKTFAKYILMIVGMYFLTMILIFISFNINYSDIYLKGELPTQVSIEKAEASDSKGRVYGYIENIKDNNVNSKFLKISVYDKSSELLTTKYLKIDGVKYGDKKLFTVLFNAKDSAYYSISIVDKENT